MSRTGPSRVSFFISTELCNTLAITVNRCATRVCHVQGRTFPACPSIDEKIKISASINMEMLVTWSKHLIHLHTYRRGQYDFTSRPIRNTIAPSARACCLLSCCSPSAFRVRLHSHEQLLQPVQPLKTLHQSGLTIMSTQQFEYQYFIQNATECREFYVSNLTDILSS